VALNVVTCEKEIWGQKLNIEIIEASEIHFNNLFQENIFGCIKSKRKGDHASSAISYRCATGL
jgi:hypothetical protein